MKTLRYLSLLAQFTCLLFLFGCTESISPLAETIATTATSERLETLLPSSATDTLPTQTLFAPSSTPSPGLEISTPTSSTTEILMKTCIQEGESVPSPNDLSIEGVLIYQQGIREGFYSIGGKPLIQSHLPLTDTKVVPIGFSPDGNWLAYAPITQLSGEEIILETPSIAMLSSTGARIESRLKADQIQDELLGILRSVANNSYWINDQLMQVTLLIDDNDPYSNDILLQKLYDPFQGTWVEEPLQNLKNRTSNQVVGFSPDMTRVLYEAIFGVRSHGIALWDVEQNSTLWTDQAFRSEDGLTLVHWSPDSSYVVAANRGKGVAPEDNLIVLVSREGDAQILADATFPTDGFINGGIRWAPDGRQLAFVNEYSYLVSADGLPELYVYDLLSKQYLLTCPLESYQDYPPDLIWSPDGAWIAMSARVPGYPLQILNVQSGEIVELVDNATAIGWSDKFPTAWP